MKLHMKIERWPLSSPFRISGYVWEAIEVLWLGLEEAGKLGQSEAAGVYFLDDTPATMLQQIEAQRARIEAGVDRDHVQKMFPPGGARNALDCALWDLEAKITGQPAWRIAGLEPPRPLLTTFGCGADTPENMAAAALGYAEAKAIKIKLTGEPVDADRVRAVRSARPDVWFSVDANQGFTRPFLEELMPVLIEARVALIEQPFRAGEEALLDGLRAPIPIAADESVKALRDIDRLVGRFQVINIKLDKCGGVTEALAMAHRARAQGMETMVGNMIGTSLGMAPAHLIGQLCNVVDLDGPLFLARDREVTVDYSRGEISCPEVLWGYPTVLGASP
jgi:L-alanine-DL-glutamate epimerase-like enolase superfamily enzyme